MKPIHVPSQGETLRLAVHVAFPEDTENVQGNKLPKPSMTR